MNLRSAVTAAPNLISDAITLCAIPCKQTLDGPQPFSKAVRAEVAAVVAELMLERGYEKTTIDDICAVAQISRSTFFRYFPSKEDALFGGVADSGEQLLAALVARPSSGTPWIAMRRALDPLIAQHDVGDERFRLIARLIVTTPPLAARHREKNARWHELLRPEVASRLGTDPADASDPRAPTP